MIIHRNLLVSMVKIKILPISLQGISRDSLGEFSNTSYGMFGGRVSRGLSLVEKL